MNSKLKASEYFYFLALSFCTVRIASFIALDNFTELIAYWAISIVCFLRIWKIVKGKEFNFLGLALILRLGFLIAVPTLSTDVYRFLWDGEIIHLGFNPYDYTPNLLIDHPKIQSSYMNELFVEMGALSQDNHSCYPVFKQCIFWISTLFTDSIVMNVLIMKIIIVGADLGVIWVLGKLFEVTKKSANLKWVYAFNPLILVEFSGAIHFEGMMLLCLLLAIYFWCIQKWIYAATLFTLAVQVKLIPLMFLPFLLLLTGWKSALKQYVIIGVLFVLTSMAWLRWYNIPNFIFTLQLYFGQFEYNAGVYVFFKFYAKWKVGYARLRHYGKVLSKLTVLGILLITFFRKPKSLQSFFNGIFAASMLYYVLVPIVHPWYIALPFTLSLFTRYNAAWLWSIIVPVSYLYYQENFSLAYYITVAIEYILVYYVLIYEYKSKGGHPVLQRLKLDLAAFE
jgi:alpha-1,6-mannosyltransferase